MMVQECEGLGQFATAVHNGTVAQNSELIRIDAKYNWEKVIFNFMKFLLTVITLRNLYSLRSASSKKIWLWMTNTEPRLQDGFLIRRFMNTNKFILAHTNGTPKEEWRRITRCLMKTFKRIRSFFNIDTKLILIKT
jgi:hypothetical protein